MNLFDYTRRPNKLVSFHPEIKHGKSRWGNAIWRYIDLPLSDTPQITLNRVSVQHSLRHHPDDIGWMVTADAPTKIAVALRAAPGGEVLAETTIEAHSGVSVVPLPWPSDTRGIGAQACFTFHATGGGARLYVNRELKREALYALAAGEGVEIGPGSAPKLFPNAQISHVSYVEEMPAEKWAELYDRSGKRGATQTDWSNYIIGTAAELPNADDSIDFVFSSHVVEHLANPIGHFLRWRKKLRKGGVILGIVPDLRNTNDYASKPSTVAELEAEHREGLWAPGEFHYQRFAELRGRKDLDQMIATQESIHVHFYTDHAMARLLQHMVDAYDFAGYRIFATRNHKDFHFALWT